MAVQQLFILNCSDRLTTEIEGSLLSFFSLNIQSYKKIARSRQSKSC
ncbi:MAG: hypothetical protein MGG37_00805 [Trichodesmium sp. MAG_R01]|nr:hypothetical protein [Trichodesmium sp. MAG_R01]